MPEQSLRAEVCDVNVKHTCPPLPLTPAVSAGQRGKVRSTETQVPSKVVCQRLALPHSKHASLWSRVSNTCGYITSCKHFWGAAGALQKAVDCQKASLLYRYR
jgi:hypothetical protein